MKAQAMRAFLEEYFVSQGAKIEAGGKQILQVRAPRRLANRLGGSSLRFAFSIASLKADSSSELAMVGNPVFDRVLELARETGRVGQRFLRPPGRTGRVPAVPKLHGSGRVPVAGAEPDRVYTPFYFFLFRVEFSLEDIPDNLEIVPLDGVTLGSPSQTPDLVEFWDGLEREPMAGRETVPAFPLPEEALRAAMSALEHRLRKRIGRLRRTAQESLARESQSISDYYQQLIDETRNASRRWVLPPGGREERIRLLQLDWRRRTEEAEANWRPRADVSLAAVGVVQRPRLRHNVAPARRGGRRRPEGSAGDTGFVYWDEVDRVFAIPSTAG